MNRFHVYEERTDKYLSYFEHYINNARVTADIGCGAGAFSRALACGKRLVIALDIEEGLLKEVKKTTY